MNELQWIKKQNILLMKKHLKISSASFCLGGDELNHACKGDPVEISGFNITLIFLNYDRCLDNPFTWPVKFFRHNRISAGDFASATCYRQTFYGLVNWELILPTQLWKSHVELHAYICLMRKILWPMKIYMYIYTHIYIFIYFCVRDLH